MKVGSAFYIAGPPFKDVEKAATYLMEIVIRDLKKDGHDAKELRVYQGGDAGLTKDFAALSLDEREEEYAKRKLRFTGACKDFFDKTLPVFCIDDCCITGTHEKAMQSFLTEDSDVSEGLNFSFW